MHRTRVTLTLCLSVLMLVGCSVPARVVRDQSVSYDDAIEDTTNELLLLNILRAKDKAPLHFDTIPSIHESIQANAQLQGTIPFGPLNKSTARDTATAGVGVQVSPSFEIDHLVTKDFATGIASPIDPKFVKYWLDRGLDRRIVLLLFFSRAEITGPDDKGNPHTIIIRNSPADALDVLEGQQRFVGVSRPLRCDTQSQFQRYLRLIDSLTTFTARYVNERKTLAKDITLNPNSQLKDLATLAALDPSKYQWVLNANGHYSIYAVSSTPKTVLCFANEPVTTDLQGPSDRTACEQSTVESADGNTKQGATPPALPEPPVSLPGSPSPYCQVFNGFLNGVGATRGAPQSTPAAKKSSSSIRLDIRSVGEMIQFLGDLVAYQEALKAETQDPQRDFRLNNPVTLGYCADASADTGKPGCADIFFNLRHTTCNTRFAVQYRGALWAVPNYNRHFGTECPGEDTEADSSGPVKDHTLEVFAVVQQLVDLQQSATDILQTPYVQVLP